ncbi:MAG: sensor domain-containing diguanylate cyclase [Psychrobium sp.]
MSNTYSQKDLAQLDIELARLQEIESYEILDTLPEQEYDDIALLSAQICKTPMSTVAIVDESRKWHKAKYGLDKEYVPRDFAICSHTICDDKLLIVEDTHQHDVFKHIGIVNNPPYVRFYAGVPLINEAGHALGTLCVIDTKPNSLTQYQQQALQALARQTMALLELRKALAISQHLEKRVSEQNRQLQALSQTDELTKLFNRRVLDRELSRELKRSKRYGGEFSLLMMDVDNFKQLNDSQGHAVGDLALVEIANLLKQESRDTDFCIRFGGDEFMLLMSNTSAEQAKDIAHRICQSVESKGKVLSDLTLSIGIAHVAEFDLTECEILKLADQGLYLAKRAGRNRVVLMDQILVESSF